MLVRNKISKETYPVHAVLFWKDDDIKVLISDDKQPQVDVRPWDIKDFDILDASIPKYWKFVSSESSSVLGFPEYVKDIGKMGKPGFFERYIDGGDQKAKKIMEKYYYKDHALYDDKYL